MTRLDLMAYFFHVTHICFPLLVDCGHPLCPFHSSVITGVCLVKLLDESVLDDIVFEAGDVRLPTAWNPAVQASAGRADNSHNLEVSRSEELFRVLSG